jgi:hypothetical protein
MAETTDIMVSIIHPPLINPQDMELDQIISVAKKTRRGGGGAGRAPRTAKPYNRDAKPGFQSNNASKGPLFTKGSKIIVSNLGFHVKSTDIKEIFSQTGAYPNPPLSLLLLDTLLC